VADRAGTNVRKLIISIVFFTVASLKLFMVARYYDHIVLLYLESRRCRYRSIIFACFYLYVSVVNLIDYSDIDKVDTADTLFI
jgi:hypothetical protein